MPRNTDRVERYARLLAEVAEGGAASRRLARLEDDVIRHPRDCLAALDRLARLPGGIEHELGAGYLMLVEAWLLNLRLMAESGRTDAAAAIAEFQSRLAALARNDAIDGDGFLALTMALGHAGVDVTAEVEAALATVMDELTAESGMADGEGLPAALDEIVPMAREAPFEFVALLSEAGHAMPAAAKAAMAAELAGREETSGIAPLLLLDPLPELRRTAADALSGIVGRIDGIALRRLITIRNWVPEAERSGIDALVRAARSAGVPCASWPEGGLEAINISSLDGAGAQSFMLVIRDGRKRHLACVLTKHGVRDAWTAQQTKAEITATLSLARRESGLEVLSRRYLDRAVRHHLHAGLAAGSPPAVGLLEVAERVGAADWVPQAFDWRAELEALVAALPTEVATEESRRRILEHSEFWSLHDPVHHSWFEEGPHVAQTLAGFKRRDRATDHVLAAVLEPARDKWAEHFTWVAFRLHECEKPSAQWQNFTVLAAGLAGGAPYADMPLMRGIAARTVEAAWAA